MRAIRVLAVLAAILVLAGCGEKEKRKPTVDESELVERDGLKYEVNSKTPFTGYVRAGYENGEDRGIGEYRAGKRDGEWRVLDHDGFARLEVWRDGQLVKLTSWHKNNQKKSELEYRDGDVVSMMEWDENGNPIKQPQPHPSPTPII